MLLYTMWPGVKYAVVGPLRQQSLPEHGCLVCEPPMGFVGMHGACYPAVCPSATYTSIQRQAVHLLQLDDEDVVVCKPACCKVLPIILLC